MGDQDIAAAIERSLREGPGYREQLQAEDQSRVVLEGEEMVRLNPDGTREELGRTRR
jgi:hypothetical protein